MTLQYTIVHELAQQNETKMQPDICPEIFAPPPPHPLKNTPLNLFAILILSEKGVTNYVQISLKFQNGL